MLCPVQIIYTACFISAMQMIMFPQSVREWDHGPRNPCLVKMAWICRCLTLECNYLNIFSVLICSFRWIVIISVYMIKLPVQSVLPRSEWQGFL